MVTSYILIFMECLHIAGCKIIKPMNFPRQVQIKNREVIRTWHVRLELVIVLDLYPITCYTYSNNTYEKHISKGSIHDKRSNSKTGS